MRPTVDSSRKERLWAPPSRRHFQVCQSLDGLGRPGKRVENPSRGYNMAFLGSAKYWFHNVLFSVLFMRFASADAQEVIKLPEPKTEGGMPLMQALKQRRSDRDFSSGKLSAFLAQNVYFFCTSEGLATVVRGSINGPALAKIMKLRPDPKITLAQSVGHPKSK